MKNRIITITDEGAVILPTSTVQMTPYEIADLLAVSTPLVKAKIKSIQKSKFVAQQYGFAEDKFNVPKFYDLEMIIGIAFIVDSYRADIFRKWVISRLSKQNLQAVFISLNNQSRDNYIC